MRPGEWLRGLWRFYLEYTETKIHAATLAAFAMFALLVFVDSFFAVLAIGVYVVPPVVFYVLDRDPALDDKDPSLDGRDESTGGIRSTGRAGSRGSRVREAPVDGDANGDTDSDSDSDSDDGDTDTDTDSDDGDTDSDSDDGDTDRTQ
ncbi:hypothetical protein [Natronosalvus vescus]|uniref:hypothetical protein n=1 Tax=Natronosalvus vescus TaxID=2953881 RepID=UPI002091C390|nr:hypothetical protein [Natronosalvus vescus]